MTIFYLLAGALLLCAMLWILRPLLRRSADVTLAREAANLDILKDQLRELDVDRNAAIWAEPDYATARDELERRALDEASDSGGDSGGDTGGDPDGAPRGDTQPWSSSRWPAVVLALLIPLGSAALYLQLGSPAAMLPVEPTSHLDAEQIDVLVEKLAQRMAEHPEDAKGWGILARSYYALGRYTEAVQAYEALERIVPPSADLYADRADALAMAQGGDLRGRPIELLGQALALDPRHDKTLLLMGSEAYARKDFGSAVRYWESLQAILPADDEFAQRLRAGIDEARAQLGPHELGPHELKPQGATPAVAGASASTGIRGNLSVAPALLAQIGPEDIVFVFARAADSKMPLAALRLQAKQLPLAFELNDTHAMRPGVLLSQHKQVIVGARISKSGNPLPQSGDLEALAVPAEAGQHALKLVIDRRVP